jgi:predicted DNA-binding WGR domain protein
MKKIVLVSKSQGERGQDGKKKVYEITVNGNVVTVSWGKAEVSARQTQVKRFINEYHAERFASEKKWAKLEKGYEVAFTA